MVGLGLEIRCGIELFRNANKQEVTGKKSGILSFSSKVFKSNEQTPKPENKLLLRAVTPANVML